MNKSKLRREIYISPAYDKRDKDPSKNYGIGSSSIFFSVRGKKGAISLRFGTNWFLKSTVEEYKKGFMTTPFNGPSEMRKTDLEKEYEPLKAWSWDIHALTNKGREYLSETAGCEFLGGKPCYCDGSSLKADAYLPILLEKGSEGIFEQLEKDYYETFNEVKQ